MASKIGTVVIEGIFDSTKILSGMAKTKAATSGLQGNMLKFSSSLQRVSGNITKVGAGLSKMSLPLIGLAALSIKAATDFESSLTKISALTSASADDVAALRDRVLDLSGETGRAPVELSEALFTIISAGQSAEEAMTTLTFASKASANGLGETNVVASALTGVMASYADQNLSAARATDILSAIVKEGNLNAAELAPTLGKITGLASIMGISFEEVGASIATFTRLGVKSADAVTGLKGLMSSILKPTKEAEDALLQVGLSFADLRKKVEQEGLAATMIELMAAFEGNESELSKVIPQVEALTSVLGTAGVQGESYAEVLESIKNNSQGLTEDAFGQTQQTAAFKFSQAMANLKTAGIELGVQFLPIIKTITEKLSEWLRKFSGLDSGTKKMIAGIIGVVAVAGPLISVIGGIAGAVAKLTALVAANPLGLMIATAILIGAVVGTATQVIVNMFDKTIDKQQILTGIIESATKAVQSETNQLIALTNTLKNSNATEELRIQAKEKLISLIPGLNAGHFIENKLTADGAALVQQHANAILARAKMRAIEARLQEIASRELELENTTIKDQISLWETVAFGASAYAIQMNDTANETSKLTQESELLAGELLDLQNEYGLTESATDSYALSTDDLGTQFDVTTAQFTPFVAKVDETGAAIKSADDKTQDWATSLSNVAKFLDQVHGSMEKVRLAGSDLIESQTNQTLELKNTNQAWADYQEGLTTTAAKQDEDTKAMKSAMLGLAATTISGLSQIFGKSKALAIADVALNTAKGISAAIAAGAGVPFPGNLAAIATGVGAVLSGIGQAKTILSAGSLAEGGIVSSPFLSIVGDAGLNNPEVVSPLSDLKRMIEPAGGKIKDHGDHGRNSER